MATRELHKLTAIAVAKKRNAGRFADGGGLYLQVGLTGAKSWLFRFTRAGVAREMGLGAAHAVSLSDARDRAQTCRRQLLDGIDPIDARNAAKAGLQLAVSRGKTFKECAEAYIAAHRSTWSSAACYERE